MLASPAPRARQSPPGRTGGDGEPPGTVAPAEDSAATREKAMHRVTLFRDRPRPAQIALGGVVPLVFGAVVGVVLGVSSGAYWALAIIAGLGAVVAGFEHQDGWGGADRGLVGGVLFGIGLLVAHAIAGTHAKVSLGGFPPLLIVIDAIFGMLLGALGGWIARNLRQRQAPVDKAV
jgi:hypothetical protein